MTSSDLSEPVHAGDHVRGAERADLELVMYRDFEWPYCAAAQGILDRVRRRLDGRVLFVFAARVEAKRRAGTDVPRVRHDATTGVASGVEVPRPSSRTARAWTAPSRRARSWMR